MQDYNNKYTEIVDSFFGAQQSLKERIRFYQWLLDGEDSEQKEQALLDKFNTYDIPFDASVEQRLQKVHDRIGATNISAKAKRISIGGWAMRVAAALIPLILIGGTIFLLNNRVPSVEFLTFHAPANEVKQIILSCNSQVWLKPNSSIVYAKGNRKVNLSGRAHFAIERDEERAFLVNTEYLQMTVLGTEFTVKEEEGSSNTLVTLTSGSLRVESAEGEPIVLQPGDQLIFDHLTGTCTVHQLDAFDLALANIWTEERLLFQQSTLKQMIRTINAYYFNRIIDFSGFTDVPSMDFTIRFNAGETLEMTLYILRELTGAFNFRFDGEKVYIYN